MEVKQLGLSENDKKGFLSMKSPKEIAEVAGVIKCQYDTAYKKLMVWFAQNWLLKQKKGKKDVYFINQDLIEL